MSKTKKLVPKRRFKKFKKIEEWKLSYLGDLLEFYSGLTYSPKNIVEKGGTLVLRSSNVKDCELVLLDKVYVDSIYVNSEFVRYGDIIVVVRNGSKHLIGKHALIKKHIKNTVIGAFMTGIRYKIPEFMNSLLDTKRFNNEIEKNLGATINQITIGHFRKMMFYIPDDIEQKDIGAFFAKLDTLIQTQQKKLEKTKTLKSAYLAVMFPKDDESKPKLRFKGMKDNWMHTKLKDVIERELKGKTKATMLGNKNIYLDANYLNGGEINYVNASKDVTLNDVLILWDGSLAGTVYHEFEGALGSTLKAYKPKESGQFLYQFLKKNQQNIFNNYRTPNIPHVIKTFTEEFRITIPHIKEQTKIGNFFKLLDQKIALEQRKLEKLNNIKQAYLNEMFV